MCDCCDGSDEPAEAGCALHVRCAAGQATTLVAAGALAEPAVLGDGELEAVAAYMARARVAAPRLLHRLHGNFMHVRSQLEQAQRAAGRGGRGGGNYQAQRAMRQLGGQYESMLGLLRGGFDDPHRPQLRRPPPPGMEPGGGGGGGAVEGGGEGGEADGAAAAAAAEAEAEAAASMHDYLPLLGRCFNATLCPGGCSSHSEAYTWVLCPFQVPMPMLRARTAHLGSVPTPVPSLVPMLVPMLVPTPVRARTLPLPPPLSGGAAAACGARCGGGATHPPGRLGGLGRHAQPLHRRARRLAARAASTVALRRR